MAYWLLKTEPDNYSYDDLEQEVKTVWDGVTNALALKHIRTMQVGDMALIYHTGNERRILGMAEIISEPYPDPKLNDSKLVVVDIQVVRRVLPVTLATIKQDGNFENFDLLRLPRLSVVPVSDLHWNRLMEVICK
jgi:predicted RNA-binding protein with PUA-like domain